MKTVTIRQSIALWRNTDYVWNKIFLHVVSALFSGFTYWKVRNNSFDLQLRLFFVLNFVYIASAAINQMQSLYLRNRDIFETREKKVCKSQCFLYCNTNISHSRKRTTGQVYFCLQSVRLRDPVARHVWHHLLRMLILPCWLPYTCFGIRPILPPNDMYVHLFLASTPLF